MPLLQATRALIDGRFGDAERLSAQALEAGERAQEPVSAMFFAIQDMLTRRLRRSPTDELRLEQAIDNLTDLARRYPALPAWRCSLAAAHAELGHEGEARAVFETLAAEGFTDLPNDTQWMLSLVLLGEVAVFLGDVARAERLYELLAALRWPDRDRRPGRCELRPGGAHARGRWPPFRAATPTPSVTSPRRWR